MNHKGINCLVMVIVYIQGGLGNQLFQYAAALSLANHLNTKVILDTTWFSISKGVTREFELPKLFNNLEILSPGKARLFGNTPSSVIRKLRKKMLFGTIDYYNETGVAFSERFFDLKNTVYLEGNFQSFKYHRYLPDNFMDMILSYKGDNSFKEKENKITAAKFVSIHIRRGDYVLDPKTQQLHGTIPMEYYYKAIEMFSRQDPGLNFMVFSDDKEFAMKNFKDMPNLTVVTDTNLSSIEELVLMAKCHHQIIANSSFSWWAAYLNKNAQKKVVCPAQWFNNPPKGFSFDDLIPQNWIKA